MNRFYPAKQTWLRTERAGMRPDAPCVWVPLFITSNPSSARCQCAVLSPPQLGSARGPRQLTAADLLSSCILSRTAAHDFPHCWPVASRLRRVCYSVQSRTCTVASPPHSSAKHSNPGLTFETMRCGRSGRILQPADEIRSDATPGRAGDAPRTVGRRAFVLQHFKCADVAMKPAVTPSCVTGLTAHAASPRLSTSDAV